jgi:hypothetical protein
MYEPPACSVFTLRSSMSKPVTGNFCPEKSKAKGNPT